MDELRELSEELDCEYVENKDGNVVIKFESFRDKFELICKPKERWTIVIKLKNGQYEKKYCFYNKEKLKSFICCQYALECFQLA
jgi:hypothetical protein